MSVALKVEALSKYYQLGEIGTGTLSRDIERWYAKIRGKEDPFLRIGEINDRSKHGHSDIVWSLKDIDFEIEKGDAVGIIGSNGAGKSTLLKILSRITSPTTGRILGNGRVTSLLEIGTGFNPELTGRENVFLNGAILGMRKAEIKKHFDAIVDFASIERYIDTPVKRYSSGMYVRLAFAVAAHLESEILVVDEVLAVGDAEFQKKCLGKMSNVSKGEGRTVLFVSHNMQAVQNLCTKGLVLESGLQIFSGNINDAIDKYSNRERKGSLQPSWNTGYYENDIVAIETVTISSDGQNVITTDSEIHIKITATIKKNKANIIMDICLYNDQGILVFDVISNPKTYNNGRYTFNCKIPKNLLNAGVYSINLYAVENHTSILFTINRILQFEIEEGERQVEYYSTWPGIIRPMFDWDITKL